MRISLNRNLMAVFAAAATFGTQAQAGLVAAWDFEGDLVDQVSNTVGTAAGGATTDGVAIAEVGSSSLNLADNTQSVNTNTTGGLGGTGSFTIIATIQTNTTANATIFNYTPTGSGGEDIRLFVQSNGDFRIEMSVGAGFNLSSNDFDLGDGQVHKVAAVFDSSTGDSFLDVDLYVDGTLYDVTSGTDHLVNIGAFAGRFVTIGRDHVSQSNRPFVGLIDDVLIYNEALSAAEIDSAVIPEPSSLALLGLGGMCLIKRRRRD